MGDAGLDEIVFIGVTGTNGKSSTVSFICQMLKALKQKCVMIGTKIIDYGDEIEYHELTTPNNDKLKEIIIKARQKGIKYVVMEVSSHALIQNRVKDINFKIAIFTNISKEHLDYHKTMDEYIKAKKILFDNLSSDSFALISGKEHSLEMVKDSKAKVIQSQFNYYFQDNVLYLEDKLVQTKLWMDTQIENLIMAKDALLLLNFDICQINDILGLIEPFKGRGEIIYDQKFKVIIDYAHTPYSLQKLYSNVNRIKKGQIITVIGCGGNRDRKKRPLIGAIAKINSDILIFTSDNSRTEKFSDIIADLTCFLSSDYRIEINRYQAIKFAVSKANKGDIILVIGKGNERYLDINEQKIPFNDEEVCLEIIGENV